MIFLGIVGTQNPMGKLVLQKIEEHQEMYRLCFRVDKNVQKSLKNAVFRDVEDALLTLSPTMVLDFGETKMAFERAKTYLRHGFPAIMLTADFTEEQLELLQALRQANPSAPTLVIKQTFSPNQVLPANWHGLEMLINYVLHHCREADIQTNVLYPFVRQN